MTEDFQITTAITRRRAQKRPRYCPDLDEQMAITAINYHRLQCLLGDVDTVCESSYQLAGGTAANTKFKIEVIQRCTYTTTLQLRQSTVLFGDLNLVIMVRLYHDMQLAEVVQPTAFSQYKGRYEAPDSQGYEVDEKAQLNRLLAEWLQQCIAYGLPDYNHNPELQ